MKNVITNIINKFTVFYIHNNKTVYFLNLKLLLHYFNHYIND